MRQQDEFFMKQALKLAVRAGSKGEVPIGALVVSDNGQLMGQGYNRVEALGCQNEHAEVRAIRSACKRKTDWRLTGYTLYVTLEPCMMCVSLSALSRIERIVYGADSPLFGYRLDKEGVLALYTKHIKNITSHVLALESAALLKQFFKQKRKGTSER